MFYAYVAINLILKQLFLINDPGLQKFNAVYSVQFITVSNNKGINYFLKTEGYMEGLELTVY